MPDDVSGGQPAGGSAPAPAAPTGGAPSAPQPIQLTAQSSFIPPGGKDAITWDKFQSGYVPKDELTRMRQKDAAQRQAWERQTSERLEREAAARWQLQQGFSGMTGRAREQELSGLFATTKRALQLPEAPIVNEMLLDIYHSYTGWETEP